MQYNSVIPENVELLRSHFSKNGLLLCNESKALPSLSSVGGDWNSIVCLIESGEAFYSKLFRGRVTYLSRAFYGHIKPYKQREAKLSQKGKEILAFLSSVGCATTAEIKHVCTLSGKAFTLCMDALFKELFITAVRRDKTMNVNWSSFYWATYDYWERLHPVSLPRQGEPAIRALLSSIMSEKQIYALLK